MKLVLSLRNQICTLFTSEYPTIASVIEYIMVYSYDLFVDHEFIGYISI